MTNRHPHADLIKQMVDDDTLRATYGNHGIESLVSHVLLNPHLSWRLVPPKPKTITIVANGKTYELPEPMRVAPEVGVEYFVTHAKGVGSWVWRKDGLDMASLSYGICHATREAAQQWVGAMSEIRGAK